MWRSVRSSCSAYGLEHDQDGGLQKEYIGIVGTSHLTGSSRPWTEQDLTRTFVSLQRSLTAQEKPGVASHEQQCVNVINLALGFLDCQRRKPSWQLSNRYRGTHPSHVTLASRFVACEGSTDVGMMVAHLTLFLLRLTLSPDAADAIRADGNNRTLSKGHHRAVCNVPVYVFYHRWTNRK